MNVSADLIMRSLSTIVGSENVSVDFRTLERYSKDQSFVPRSMPFCVVWPKSVEEVRQIVLAANRYKFPVTPYSSGTTFQGAHIPAPGSVVVNLSRMNRVQLVDDVNRIAIIESGVTFNQLQDELKKHGLRALTAIGVPATASVLATYLERIPLYAWPRYGPWQLLTLEVVLPTGEIVRTEHWAIPTADRPSAHMTMFGGIPRMFVGAQGTLGIITKATIGVYPLYEARKVFFIPVKDVKDAVSMVQEVRLLEIGETVFIANNSYLSLILDTEDISPWTVVIVLSDWEERLRCEEEDLKDAASRLGLELSSALPASPEAEKKILREIESPEGVPKLSRYKGAYNFIPAYVPTKRIPTAEKMVREMACEYGYPEEDISIFMLPVHVGAYYFEAGFHRNPADPHETEKVEKLFYESAKRLLDIGAFIDRPYGRLAELVYSRCGGYYGLLKKIKAMYDPNNIMNPGRLNL